MQFVAFMNYTLLKVKLCKKLLKLVMQYRVTKDFSTFYLFLKEKKIIAKNTILVDSAILSRDPISPGWTPLKCSKIYALYKTIWSYWWNLRTKRLRSCRYKNEKTACDNNVKERKKKRKRQKEKDQKISLKLDEVKRGRDSKKKKSKKSKIHTVDR